MSEAHYPWHARWLRFEFSVRLQPGHFYVGGRLAVLTASLSFGEWQPADSRSYDRESRTYRRARSLWARWERHRGAAQPRLGSLEIWRRYNKRSQGG